MSARARSESRDRRIGDVAHIAAISAEQNPGIMRKSDSSNRPAAAPMCMDPLLAHGSSVARLRETPGSLIYQRKAVLDGLDLLCPMCGPRAADHPGTRKSLHERADVERRSPVRPSTAATGRERLGRPRMMAGLGAVRLMADGPVLVAQTGPAQSGSVRPTRGRIIRGMERATAIVAIWNASTVVESGAEIRPAQMDKVMAKKIGASGVSRANTSGAAPAKPRRQMTTIV